MYLTKRAFLAAMPLVVAAAPAVHAGKVPRPEPPKRLIVNDDGHGGFYGGRLNSAEALRILPQRYKGTHVWIYQWGVMLGTKVNYPSQVSELCGEGVPDETLAQVREGDRKLAGLLRKLRDEGTDTLKCVVEGCHEAGILCYASFRANPVYPLSAGGWPGDSMARYFNSRFWWEHPEYRILQKSGKEHVALSYAYPAVRGRVLSLMREVLQRDVDGIDIDFLRHPPFFGYEAPLSESFRAKFGVDPKTLPDDDERWLRHRGEVMTAFFREIRQAVDAAGKEKGRHLGISVRVDHRYCKLWGLDIETWMKEGLIDLLIVGQHTLGGYEFDLSPFVRMAEGTGCLVLPSEEAIVTGRDPTPQDEEDRKAGKPAPQRSHVMTVEEHCERGRRWYEQGAAGIHLFNQGNIEVMRTLGSPPPAKSEGEPFMSDRSLPRFEYHLVDDTLPITDGTVGNYGHTALADLDRDGDLDFIVGRMPDVRRGVEGIIYWYDYQAPGCWERHVLARDPHTGVGAWVMDVGGDGWLDVVGGSAWYRNPGNPREREFTRYPFDPKEGRAHDVIAADIDGDGRPEIITLTDGPDGIRWYKIPEDPTGEWERHVIGPGIHGALMPSAIGDIDGDGNLDIVCADTWYENRGGKGLDWVPHKNIPFGRVGPYGMCVRCVVIDIDGDGKQEIVMADADIIDSHVAILRNVDGRGGEWERQDLPQSFVYGSLHSFAVADFTGTGRLDILAAEQEELLPEGRENPRWILWQNLGNGEFREHLLLDNRLGSHELQVGDVDGDGRLDIVSKPWSSAPWNACGGKIHVDFLRNVTG